MSVGSKAVFLSYASQDAEAARRICDALRAAGVEVWFDLSELRGGDAWDQKIRKQIKECALFVPIISANTNARLEGYFRREWRLAVDRMHDMDDEVPFLLPVVIDETSDAAARVPERFRERQWVRVAGGVASAEFCARVQRLLAGEVATAVAENRKVESRGPKTAAGPPRTRSRLWLPFVVAILAAGVVIPSWVYWRNRVAQPPAAGRKNTSTLADERNFPHDPNLRRAWVLIMDLNFTSEDLALAEDIVKPVLSARPSDPEPAIVYTWLSLLSMARGADMTDERYALTARYAERAVQLAPNNAWALAGLARFLSTRRADLPRAERLARQAIALNSHEPRLYGVLKTVLIAAGQPTALAVAEDASQLFPNDALTWYELQGTYRNAGRLEEADKALERTLELAPMATAMAARMATAFEHGDIATMRAMLDQIPDAFRATDRVMFWRYVYAYVVREPSAALRQLQAFPGDWIRDANYTGPKAFLIGDLLLLDGKTELARVQFEAALSDVQQKLARSPSDPALRATEQWILWRLGRSADPKVAAEILEAAASNAFADWAVNSLWFGAIRGNLLFGQRQTAIGLMKSLTAAQRATWRRVLAFDPRLASWREDAEIKATLGEPISATGANTTAVIDAKSVVVLPFANLSGDPEQEYFSDGLTEEILNALARERDLRVPGRASAFSFKGKNASAAEIAKALKVAQLVEGSVRKSGNKVRISVQLTRASDGFSEALPTVERELTDIFALQDEVARLVVEKLTKRATTTAPVAVLTAVPEAYDAYLRGRALQTKAAGLRNKAAAEYERAVSLDPKFALAWARLAEARFRDFGGQYDRGPQMIEATRVAIGKALGAQPDLAEALIVRANWARGVQQDYAAAERDLARAAALQPPTGELRMAQAGLARERGQIDENFRLYREAVQLDPENGDTTNAVGLGLSLAGLFLEADRYFVRSMATQGSGPPFYNRMNARLRWRGPEAALRLAERISRDPTRPLRETDIAKAMVHVGRLDEARAIYARLYATPRANAEPLFALGDESTEVLSYLGVLGLDEIERARGLEWRNIAREQMRSRNGAPFVRLAIVRTELALGNLAAAAEALREWRDETAKTPNAYRQNSDFARHAVGLYAQLGRPDEEIALLRQLQKDPLHRGRLGFELRSLPALAPLRNDPRFQAIVREEEAWVKVLPDPVDL